MGTTPSHAARQEVLIDRNATVEVREVLCTPAAVGVALVFDPAFGAQSTVAVDCGGEALAFRPPRAARAGSQSERHGR